MGSVQVVSEPPNFGEVKGSCLTSVKIWLYEDELLAKLLRAPFYVPSKVCHDVHLHSAVSWPKSNHLPSISSHLGVLTERDTLSTMCIIKAYGASRVNFIHGDITQQDTLLPACQGMDAVVCAVGARAGWRPPCCNNDTPKCVDYLGVKALAEAAALAGVPKFVLVSSMAVTRSCDKISCLLNTLFGRVLHWKYLGEEALRNAYRHEGLAYYIVRPGGLNDNLGGILGLTIEQGDQGSGSITRIDVASVVLACVEGHSTPNVTFEVFNNKNKYAPTEDLNKLYSLESDETVPVGHSQVTSPLIP